MKRLITFCLVIFLIGISGEVYSQINSKQARKMNKRIASYKGQKTYFAKSKRYNSVGVSLNAMNYFGDIAPTSNWASTDLKFTRPGLGLSFEHRFGPRYSLRAAFNYGRISGSDFSSADPNDPDDRYRYVRNMQFRNMIKELSVIGVFDLFKNEGTFISRVQWTPYVFAGVAIFHHNPQGFVPDVDGLAEAGTWVNLQPLGTEGQFANLPEDAANHGIEPYSRVQLAIPFGLGVRYRINPMMDLAFEVGVRYTFTDYLDDVSRNYVDLTLLDSDLARAMSYRSDEAVFAPTGAARDLANSNIAEIVNNRYAYPDGSTVVAGFGHEHPENIRGNRNDNDIYVVTSIRLTYILGSSFVRPKFR